MSQRAPHDRLGPELEGRLRESEARLRGIVDSAMDAIVSVDESQRIALFNPAAEAMFGHRAKEVLGQPLDLLLPERFRAAHRSHVGRFGETGATSRRMGKLGQVWGLRASGEEFPLEASISQVQRDGSRLLTVILRDASERERATETARLLARMVESSEDAIVGKDLEGRILSWNPAAERIYGYRAEEVLGRSISALVPPEQREEVALHLATLRGGSSPEPFETTRLRKDGQRIRVVLRVSPIRDATGAIIGASCTARDVTARWRMERRLREAEELASMGTLVAGLAHDIGTPLNVVLGYADLLERSLREEQNRERARTIREQVKRVAKLIQTLLNLARPHPAVRAPVAIEALLDESLGFLRETLRRRDVTSERDYAGVGQVQGDPERLERAFLNLLLNAADAMRGGGTLRVSTRCLGEDAVEVRVRDTGDGIPAELQERIFEPFYTTKPPGQGSGLGLLVTRSAVVDHGGSIELDSEVGKGAEFRVVLPREGRAETPQP